MGGVKNMAVVGIIAAADQNLYKVVTWDNAYLDISTKVCDRSELNALTNRYVAVDSLSEEIMKRKLVTVPYLNVFDSMRYGWSSETFSFMYAYFDCLRWLLANKVRVTADDQEVSMDTVRVDLEQLMVMAGDVVIFGKHNSDYEAKPLKIYVSEMPKDLYAYVATQFALTGMEDTFRYVPVRVVSNREQCSYLFNYARQQDCLGQLYVLDQILGRGEYV